MIERLLNIDQRQRARAIGYAMRLGADVSGRSAQLLRESHLRLRDGQVLLSVNTAWADILLGENVPKRLAQLADCLGMQPDIVERI